MKLDAKKVFFALIATNILLVVVTLVAFGLANSIDQKKSKQISDLKADYQTNDQLISYYKVLQGNLNANKDLQTTLQKVLPSDKDQTAAINDLNQFSKDDNVPISQISFNPGTNTAAGKTLTSPSGINGVSIIAVSLTSTGTRYENLLMFLHNIETTQRRMQVASLNITPNATNPDLLDQVTLIIDIYLKAGA